ncbi:hypothetical protein FQN57_005821 [Myotisia sp. PD_48]|nr:hypothetical protein FQN57_005821 [Myotisia sp. PD_48]
MGLQLLTQQLPLIKKLTVNDLGLNSVQTHEQEHPVPKKQTGNGLYHLNFAFAHIKDNTLSTASPNDNELYRSFTALKTKKPSLKCFLSVGGWSAGVEVFSKLARSASSRKSFVQSAVTTLEKYGFDGLDIDWDYPAASDRGGSSEDFENYRQLLKELRDAFKPENYGLAIAIPASYSSHVDWFNFMAYDLHITPKPHVAPLTNLTEISTGLDLLWRNSIPPEKVSLGLAFYGRSFTLANPKCNTPDCPFKQHGGRPGKCTATEGSLSNLEISRILKEKSPKVQYDKTAAVNWISWDNDQWVSYDDEKTLKQKTSFANQHCLGGTFAWSLDFGAPGTMDSPGTGEYGGGGSIPNSNPPIPIPTGGNGGAAGGGGIPSDKPPNPKPTGGNARAGGDSIPSSNPPNSKPTGVPSNSPQVPALVPPKCLYTPGVVLTGSSTRQVSATSPDVPKSSSNPLSVKNSPASGGTSQSSPSKEAAPTPGVVLVPGSSKTLQVPATSLSALKSSSNPASIRNSTLSDNARSIPTQSPASTSVVVPVGAKTSNLPSAGSSVLSNSSKTPESTSSGKTTPPTTPASRSQSDNKDDKNDDNKDDKEDDKKDSQKGGDDGDDDDDDDDDDGLGLPIIPVIVPFCVGPHCRLGGGGGNRCMGPSASHSVAKVLVVGCPCVPGPNVSSQCTPGPVPACTGPSYTPVSCWGGKDCQSGMCTGPECKRSDEKDCQKPDTVPRCTVFVSVSIDATATRTESTRSECATVTGCSLTAMTTTTTETESSASAVTVTGGVYIPETQAPDQLTSIAKKLYEMRQRSETTSAPDTTTSGKPSSTTKKSTLTDENAWGKKTGLPHLKDFSKIFREPNDAEKENWNH